jgi:hypothetical protein
MSSTHVWEQWQNDLLDVIVRRYAERSPMEKLNGCPE